MKERALLDASLKLQLQNVPDNVAWCGRKKIKGEKKSRDSLLEKCRLMSLNRFSRHCLSSKSSGCNRISGILFSRCSHPVIFTRRH